MYAVCIEQDVLELHTKVLFFNTNLAYKRMPGVFVGSS